MSRPGERRGLFFPESRDDARKWADWMSSRACFSRSSGTARENGPTRRAHALIFSKIPRLREDMGQPDEIVGLFAAESRDCVRQRGDRKSERAHLPPSPATARDKRPTG